MEDSIWEYPFGDPDEDDDLFCRNNGRKQYRITENDRANGKP